MTTTAQLWDTPTPIYLRTVDTPAGPITVWDEALRARGYQVNDAGAYALAYDLLRDNGEMTV